MSNAPAPRMPRPKRRIQVDGRAVTPDEKRVIVERILRAWQAQPHLRLGQLLTNAVQARGGEGTLFYVEDDVLATIAELFASAERVKA